MFNMPDDICQGMPLPEKQQEGETSEQHIGAPFNWLRNKSSPPTLKSWTGHYTMLDGEEIKKQDVNQKRLTEKGNLAGIDEFGHDDIANTFDGIKKR